MDDVQKARRIALQSILDLGGKLSDAQAQEMAYFNDIEPQEAVEPAAPVAEVEETPVAEAPAEETAPESEPAAPVAEVAPEAAA